MQVLETLETVKIHTEDGALFKQARELIYKNFSGCIGKKSKLISFCKDDELVQRRYFFKWLNCLNRRINHTDLHLERSFYKTVHLKLLQKEALRRLVQAKIHFENSAIRISFSALDAQLGTYLRNYFKDHTCKVINNDFVIVYQNDRTLELLASLAEKNEHLDRYISCQLDELEFLRAKKSLAANAQKSVKKANRFLNLCALYEEQFKTLGIELGASASEVKKAYRALARKYHPDYHPHASEQIKALCAERFSAISNAYECLKPLYEELV